MKVTYFSIRLQKMAHVRGTKEELRKLATTSCYLGASAAIPPLF